MTYDQTGDDDQIVDDLAVDSTMTDGTTSDDTIWKDGPMSEDADLERGQTGGHSSQTTTATEKQYRLRDYVC